MNGPAEPAAGPAGRLSPADLPRPRYFRPRKAAADSVPGGGTVRCALCPRFCVIPPGEFGRCGVRQNRDGVGAIPFYGHITAMAADPIEKKPLYHFRPGSSILSLGFLGCNLRCPFCQNWHISQGVQAESRRLSPGDLIAAAQSGGFNQIAYTYSEPLVHIEFLLDCMEQARRAGIANVLVSNGCVNPEAAADILALTDAANIDLKSFSAETYSRILGGDLKTVLAFIRAAHAADVHLELTTLIVPGVTDTPEETDCCAAFISGLSRDIPWHLSAYHPAYQWEAPPTDPSLLLRIARRARESLSFVYVGNIAANGEFSDTPCPSCGKTLVQRRGYRINPSGLTLRDGEAGQQYYCAHCGKPAPFFG